MISVLIESHALFKQEKYDKAVKLLTVELSKKDENFKTDEIYRLRGECFVKLFNFKDAISDLERYFGDIEEIQANEDNFKPLLALANSYLQTNEIIKATSLLLKAATLKPEDKSVKITLSTIDQEYFGKDNDTDIPSLLIKGKLFSEITILMIGQEKNEGLINTIHEIFVRKFQKARERNSNLVIMDVLTIGSNVTTEMIEIWDNNYGFVSHVHIAYLAYEVANKIHSYNFFVMDLNELYRSIFQPAYGLYVLSHPDLSKFNF